MRQISAISNANSDEGDHNHNTSSTTPCPSNKEGGDSSTKETVATMLSDGDDEQILQDPTSQPVVVPQDIFCEDDMEVFDCSICLTEIEEGEQVGILPCIHIFHVDCLRQWITRKNACPLCQIAEIASPRSIEMENGELVNPVEEETAYVEGNMRGNEVGLNNNDSIPNNVVDSTPINGAPWNVLNSFSSTLDRSALVNMERRRFRRDQTRQRRRRRRGASEDGGLSLYRR